MSTTVTIPIQTRRPILVGFDYAKLDSSTADLLQQAAERIRSYRRSVARAIINIGVNLLDAKARLDHGQFGSWLRAEFDWSERTAQNYMKVADVFRSKSETVADLPPAFIYKLAAPSTPEGIQKRVVADLEAGQSIDCSAVTREIEETRRLNRADREPQSLEAVREASAILAKLSLSDRQRLLQLLQSARVREGLNNARASVEVVPEETSEPFPELPDFLDRRKNRTIDHGAQSPHPGRGKNPFKAPR